MSEKDQEKIDLLFTGYLDGELTERQQTELKRLLQTYPSLNEELSALRRQKELLGVLPVEHAPATLAADVQAALERSMILEPAESQDGGRWNACLLFTRRIVSAAAMLLLPIGLLGLLIFQIMRPVETNPNGPDSFVSRDGGLKTSDTSEDPANGLAAMRGDAGRLVLHTDQPILVNRFVEKRVHLHNLLNDTMPTRQADKTVYEIECSSERLVRFLDDLPVVWKRCSNAEYFLAGGETESDFVVNRIQPTQLRTLITETNPDNKRRSASLFARINEQAGEFLPQPATVEEMTPSQPVIAWPEETDETATPEGPKVRFTLEVQNATMPE